MDIGPGRGDLMREPGTDGPSGHRAGWTDPAGRFAVPAAPSCAVSRTRTVRRLHDAVARPLTVVSAPAGTGKTSLLAEWARTRDPADTGWISFEDADDPFWTLLLDRLADLGVSLPSGNGHRTDPDAVGMDRARLRAVAGAVAGCGRVLTLVLDDYDVPASRAGRIPGSHDGGRGSSDVAVGVDFLLRHTSGRLRLVLSGRTDPPLPLYRYRLTDTLAELRTADLAFDDDEAARLLTGLGADVDPDTVHRLTEHYDGWAAGLRLVGRHLAEHPVPDARGGPGEPPGELPDVDDYLRAEVLDPKPGPVRELLLHTSVAEPVSTGIAEALAGPGAARTLRRLPGENTFVTPLPPPADGYRYPPFFRRFLRARLAETPREWAGAHRRTAAWLRSAGRPEQALAHLCEVGDWHTAA
ncbi:MalT transcriptional regulator family protein, partial [Saccharomonospora iraqiensis]